MKKLMVVMFALAFAGSARAQSADALQKALNREATSLASWTTNKTIVDAVKQQNAKNVAAAEVQKIDKEWQGGGAAAAVKQATTGPCADALRTLTSSNARYGETFVTDTRGAIVCATQRTSDYWQGDEPKWERPFTDGKAFIDRPRMDDSAKLHLAQVSLPVADGGKTIGVLTVGIIVEKIK
jgi:hypothetical protein